jgi:hypothetical protein
MSQYYTETPGKYPDKLPDLKPGEIRGQAWSAFPENGRYIFEYVSGELAGRCKRFEIKLSEYEALKANELSTLDLLNRYGAY